MTARHVPQPTTSLCVYPTTPTETLNAPDNDERPGHATLRLPGLTLLFTGPDNGDALVSLDLMRAALDDLRARVVAEATR